MKSIGRSQLRNRIRKAVERIRVTVNGRPVAELVPIGGVQRPFVARDEVMRILAHAPLDRDFADDIEDAVGATRDEV